MADLMYRHEATALVACFMSRCTDDTQVGRLMAAMNEVSVDAQPMMVDYLRLLNEASGVDECMKLSVEVLTAEQDAAFAAAALEEAAAKVAGEQAGEAGTHISKRARVSGEPSAGLGAGLASELRPAPAVEAADRGLGLLRTGLSALREAAASQAAGSAGVGEMVHKQLREHLHQVHTLLQELR